MLTHANNHMHSYTNTHNLGHTHSSTISDLETHEYTHVHTHTNTYFPALLAMPRMSPVKALSEKPSLVNFTEEFSEQDLLLLEWGQKSG